MDLCNYLSVILYAFSEPLSCPFSRACSSTWRGSWSGATRRRSAAGAITCLCLPRSGRTRRTRPSEAPRPRLLHRLFPPKAQRGEAAHVAYRCVYTVFIISLFGLVLSYFTFFTWTKKHKRIRPSWTLKLLDAHVWLHHIHTQNFFKTLRRGQYTFLSLTLKKGKTFRPLTFFG